MEVENIKLALTVLVIVGSLLMLLRGLLRPSGATTAAAAAAGTARVSGTAREDSRKRRAGRAITRDGDLRSCLEIGEGVNEPTVLVAVEILMRSDGTVAPEASSAARRLSGLGGPVVLCARARSDEEEAAVRAALKEAGVFAEEDGLESHRLVFYSTDVGRRAIARQLEPHVLLCPDAWLSTFCDVTSRVPCVVAVGLLPGSGSGTGSASGWVKERPGPARLIHHVASVDQLTISAAPTPSS